MRNKRSGRLEDGLIVMLYAGPLSFGPVRLGLGSSLAYSSQSGKLAWKNTLEGMRSRLVLQNSSCRIRLLQGQAQECL